MKIPKKSEKLCVACTSGVRNRLSDPNHPPIFHNIIKFKHAPKVDGFICKGRNFVLGHRGVFASPMVDNLRVNGIMQGNNKQYNKIKPSME